MQESFLGSQSFLLSADAGLLKVFTLAQLRQDACFLALLLEAPDGTLNRFALLDTNPGHASLTPSHAGMDAAFILAAEFWDAVKLPYFSASATGVKIRW